MRILKELNRRTSIKTKGVLYVMLLIVVIYISVSIIVLSSSRKNLLMQRKQFHLSIAEKLAINASDAIISEDFGFLMEQIRQLKDSGQIKNARVIDKRGIIVASDEVGNIGRFDRYLSGLLSKTARPGDTESDDCSISLPIEIDGDLLGALSLTFDTEREDRAFAKDFHKTMLQLFYLSLVIFAFGIGGSYVVSLLMTRPITNLSKEIEEFEKEISYTDRGAEGNSLYKDETEQLRQVFYHMLETLRRYLSEFRRVSEEKERLTCMAAIGEMSAQIAHEIRNSLYAIRGAISGIEKSKENAEVQEYIEIIKDEAVEMSMMADNFLRFARLPAPSPVLCNIIDVLDKVTELLEPDLEESGVHVVYDRDVRLPLVMVDPALMKQVFMNLFINAIQAMRKGGRIDVKFSTSDRWLEIHVRDNGPGIAEEIAVKVFQPFFTTKNDGSGLGLATVYKIILAHHGEIELLKSRTGAYFLIKLPLQNNSDLTVAHVGRKNKATF
ncbi:MAG: hypothetical protein GXO97_07055 [Nitrospirae bacterium]|nr:hypothetical protein [Nitrospirota bacterium]